MPTPFVNEAEAELRAEAQVFRDLSPEHLLTAIFLKYVLREGELTSSEFRACFTDGTSDGGIDAIANHEQDDLHRIALVQSKRVAKIDKNDIVWVSFLGSSCFGGRRIHMQDSSPMRPERSAEGPANRVLIGNRSPIAYSWYSPGGRGKEWRDVVVKIRGVGIRESPWTKVYAGVVVAGISRLVWRCDVWTRHGGIVTYFVSRWRWGRESD